MRRWATLAGVVTMLAGVLAGAPAADAQEYPWCAVYGKGHGGRNCGFVTYDQCMAAISGNGGYCERNPFYPADDRRPRPRRPAPR